MSGARGGGRHGAPRSALDAYDLGLPDPRLDEGVLVAQQADSMFETADRFEAPPAQPKKVSSVGNQVPVTCLDSATVRAKRAAAPPPRLDPCAVAFDRRGGRVDELARGVVEERLLLRRRVAEREGERGFARNDTRSTWFDRAKVDLPKY